jgi:hypothetical protein
MHKQTLVHPPNRTLLGKEKKEPSYAMSSGQNKSQMQYAYWKEIDMTKWKTLQKKKQINSCQELAMMEGIDHKGAQGNFSGW